MAQYEKLYNDAYGPIIKKMVYKNLKKDTIRIGKTKILERGL